MYKALKALYRRGKLNDAGIYKAAADGLITNAQAKEITGDATESNIMSVPQTGQNESS